MWPKDTAVTALAVTDALGEVSKPLHDSECYIITGYLRYHRKSIYYKLLTINYLSCYEFKYF